MGRGGASTVQELCLGELADDTQWTQEHDQAACAVAFSTHVALLQLLPIISYVLAALTMGGGGVQLSKMLSSSP